MDARLQTALAEVQLSNHPVFAAMDLDNDRHWALRTAFDSIVIEGTDSHYKEFFLCVRARPLLWHRQRNAQCAVPGMELHRVRMRPPPPHHPHRPPADPTPTWLTPCCVAPSVH